MFHFLGCKVRSCPSAAVQKGRFSEVLLFPAEKGDLCDFAGKDVLSDTDSGTDSGGFTHGDGVARDPVT